MPRANFCFSFIHALYCVIWGVFLSLTHAMLFYVWSFFTCPVLRYVASFSYTPHAIVCGEFLTYWLNVFRCCIELLHISPVNYFCGGISHKTRRLAKLFKAVLSVLLVRKLLNSPRSDSCSLLQWKTCIPP